jgi:hypothetical protein
MVMKAKKIEFIEPVLGEERGQRSSSALSEIKLTPRNELGAARVHTRSRKSNPKKEKCKTISDYQNLVADLEIQLVGISEQLRASHDENREMGSKYKKLLRQMESIHVRASDALEIIE